MSATDTKTYRGRTLEEVLPKIKAELGPDAEIVRQRSGLTGGVGGFFQRQCVEVDARAPFAAEPARSGRRFDAYDDAPALPEPYLPAEEPVAFVPDPLADVPTSEGLSAPGIQEILRQAAPFAEQLGTALGNGTDAFEAQASARTAPRVDAPQAANGFADERRLVRESRVVDVAPAAGRPVQADALAAALVDAGIASAVVADLIDRTVDHELPFVSPRSLKRLVRRALAGRIPIAPPAAAGARSLAFVGPGGSGKTLSSARLAAAYASRAQLPVVCVALRPTDGGAELAALLEPLGVGVRVAGSGAEARAHLAGAVDHALVLVDTPAVAPRSSAEVAALAADLEALGLDEVHLALPATYSGPAARELGDLLAPLAPTHLALTHMDATSHVGALIDYAIDAGRPISYLSEGTGVPGGLEPAAPDKLATLLLP